jgi:hypothetical protein
VGSGGNKWGGKRCIGDVGEVEERARKGVAGVTCAGELGVADEHVGATVVGEGRAKVIAPGPVFGRAIAGGVMGYNKLARGMNGD